MNDNANNNNNQSEPINSRSTFRNIFGTWFMQGLDAETMHKAFELAMAKLQYKYRVHQIECCPDTGRLHIQFYFALRNPLRLNTIKNKLPGAHIQPRRGTHEHAVNYCTKERTAVLGPWEDGSAPKPGKRNDILALHDDLKAGHSVRDIADAHFGLFLKFSKSIITYSSYSSVRRNWKSKVTILWGCSGAGKTYHVFNNHPMESIFTLSRPASDSRIWWDGYVPQQHSVLLIDDFYGWIKLDYMLKLLDAYPYSLEIKGGMVQCLFKEIYLTSNQSWDTWYKFDTFIPELKVAFERRLDVIRKYFDKWDGDDALFENWIQEKPMLFS